MNSGEKIADVLASLDAGEKRALLAALLADSEAVALPGKRAPFADLARAERWLWERAESAEYPRRKDSRLRTWFIFMLLRFGGLRMEEIFRMSARDLDLDSGLIYVREGRAPRIAPLPPEVVEKMTRARKLWREADAKACPFLCDAGRIRRAFKECEKALDLPRGLINARSMRRARGREMELCGIGPDLADIFMGRASSDDESETKLAARLLKRVIQGKTRSSARNSFVCVAARLETGGIIVPVHLETSTGLEILANITETSRAALDLAPGTMVRALVKAPWVSVFAADEARAGANNFYGTVSSAKRDGEAAEIIVSLPEGCAVCALYWPGRPEKRRFAVGEEVFVHFDPFAVIISRD